MTFKGLRFTIVGLAMLFFWIATPSMAQNLITNGDFESGNTGFESDYTYYEPGVHPLSDAGVYVVKRNPHDYHPSQFFDMGDHTSGTGKFFIANGKGLLSNYRVWARTVTVQPNTTYNFTFWATHISNGQGENSRAKFRVQINGTQIGSDFVPQFASGGYWDQFPTATWNSGTNTQATIIIYDRCTLDSGFGDDFGIDDISFSPNITYSVQANNDSGISVCRNVSQDINVLDNDVISPDANGAVVTIVTQPAHGLAIVVNNTTVRYTFSGGNYTTDQLKYRVTTHGVYGEAWVYINTNQPPTVANITAPGSICVGSPLGIPTPSVTPNVAGHWEYCQTQSGSNWTQFDPSSIPMSMNNYYVRYTATNECGDGNSNAVQIHVSDEPTIGTPVTPSAICAGGSFSLTTPTIQNNGSAIIGQGWQIAQTQNGTYNAFNNQNVPYSYNGYWIRYYAENDCGLTYSVPVQITVNDLPIVGSIAAPAAICAGESFNLTTPSVTWRHVNQGTGSWEIQVNGTWQPLTNNNIPYLYNGCSIRYKAVNGCGESYSTNTVQVTVYSTDPVDEGEMTACDFIYHHGTYCNHTGTYVADSVTPNGCTIQVSWHFTLGEAFIAPVQYEEACDFYYWPKTHRTYYQSNVYDTIIYSPDPQVCDSTFTLNLTINHAPSILNDLQAPSEICVGELLNVSEPQYQMNHSGGGRTRWDYATSQTGPFHSFDPTTYHPEHGRYYLRFAVINGCDSVFSNVVQADVNDEPVISGQLNNLQVCVGNTLDLPEVSVDWMNQNVNDRFAEWQMSATQGGTFSSFNPSTPLQMAQNGYWIQYLARNSCGEVTLGPVRITVIDEMEEWVEHEGCDVVWYAGNQYTADAVVDEELYDPCLHTIHHNIVVHHSDRPENNPTLIEEVTSCHDEYEWHGNTYLRADGAQTVTWTAQNIWGCDSIRELRLDFGDYAKKTEPVVECNEFTWPRNNVTYEYDESHPQVLDSIFIPGDEVVCDSMIYLNLTLGRSYSDVEGEAMTECSGFEWHGVTYYSDAVVYDTLKTAVTQCDSIISHQLTIIQPYHTEFEMTNCQDMWWFENHCDHDGDYDHLFTSIDGCDSLVTMHFTLGQYIEYEFDTLACERFQWYGNSCSESGQSYTHVFQTSQGCDSIVTMHLTLNVTQVFTQFVAACDSTFENGAWYYPGNYYIYYDTVYTQNGCDSLIFRYNLTVSNSESVGMIEGSHDVYVASNLVSGIYRYDIDTTGVNGNVTWSLTNPDWQIVEIQPTYCRVLVATPGSSILSANFQTLTCGAMERQFEINAGFFGLDEQGIETNIYPNPTKGTLTVEAEGIESIRVVNMMGQTLAWNEYGRDDSVILSLNDLKPSVYLLEIKTMNGVARRRVVLQR